MADRRIDLNELRERVRRRGLLGAFAERPPTVPEPAQAPPPPLEWRVEDDPLPPPAAAGPDERDTVEFVLDPEVAEKLRGCRLSCAAVITALADLPAIEAGGQVLDVALVRMTVRRPEGDAECCVRQAIPPEVRGVVGPGAGVMVLAHEHDRSVAAIDWTATGDWVGAKLTFPTAHQQYDWPPRPDWPAPGSAR